MIKLNLTLQLKKQLKIVNKKKELFNFLGHDIFFPFNENIQSILGFQKMLEKCENQ